MRSSRAILFALASFLILLLPPTANALDIPLLTWERGKEQNLVLGGNTENEWRIELVDETNVSALTFEASEISATGFVVYSAFIPMDFPIGAYAVRATGIGIPGSIVAGVNIVTLNFYELLQIPFELLWILLGYLFVTAAFGVMRIRRYSFISVRDEEQDLDLLPRSMVALYRLREKSTRNLNPSLFQVVLKREGEWLRNKSLVLWCTLPIAGLIAGFAIGVLMLREGGLGEAPWILLFIGAIISLFDLYSGVIAFAGLVLSHLIFGDVTSLRDVMALLALALGWAGAYAMGSTFHLLSENQESSSRVNRIQASLLSGAAAGVTFHSAQILILSLVVNVTDPASVDWRLSLLVGIAVIGKSSFRSRLEGGDQADALSERSEIVIGRLISPKSALFLLVFFAGTLHIWIRDWIPAIALALALVAPYGFLLVRFGGPRWSFLAKIPRNPLLESLLIVGLGYLIFVALEDLPFEVLEKSRLFLILGVVPVLLHGLFSILWDIQDREEINGPVVETFASGESEQ